MASTLSSPSPAGSTARDDGGMSIRRLVERRGSAFHRIPWDGPSMPPEETAPAMLSFERGEGQEGGCWLLIEVGLLLVDVVQVQDECMEVVVSRGSGVGLVFCFSSFHFMIMVLAGWPYHGVLAAEGGRNKRKEAMTTGGRGRVVSHGGR